MTFVLQEKQDVATGNGIVTSDHFARNGTMIAEHSVGNGTVTAEHSAGNGTVIIEHFAGKTASPSFLYNSLHMSKGVDVECAMISLD